MAIEIERKFLVNKAKWDIVEKVDGRLYKQMYLVIGDKIVVRVRLVNDKAYLTIKGKTTGFSRSEFEYLIPTTDAGEMFSQFAGSSIEKIRYKVKHSIHIWDVDVFLGTNSGLIMAEIELKNESEPFLKPEWLGEEVTGDERYYNSYLAQHPYSTW